MILLTCQNFACLPLNYYYYYFLAHQHKAAGRKTRLDIQNYGCNGNLLYIVYTIIIIIICVLVTTVHPAKTAATVEMLFGYNLGLTQGTMFYTGPDAPQKGALFSEMRLKFPLTQFANVPISRRWRQCGVTLNFSDKNPPPAMLPLEFL